MDFVSDTFSGYKSLFVLCLQLVVRRAVVGDIYFGWQSVPHRTARETIWGSSRRPSYGSPSIQHRTRLHYYEAMLAILSSSKTHFFRTFRRTQWHSQEHWRCKCLILSFLSSQSAITFWTCLPNVTFVCPGTRWCHIKPQQAASIIYLPLLLFIWEGHKASFTAHQRWKPRMGGSQS